MGSPYETIFGESEEDLKNRQEQKKKDKASGIGTGPLKLQASWWKGVAGMNYSTAMQHLKGQAPELTSLTKDQFQWLQKNWEKYVTGAGTGDYSFDYSGLKGYLVDGHPSEISASSRKGYPGTRTRGAGRAGTILTSPLGVSETASMKRRTVLGR